MEQKDADVAETARDAFERGLGKKKTNRRDTDSGVLGFHAGEAHGPKRDGGGTGGSRPPRQRKCPEVTTMPGVAGALERHVMAAEA